MRSDIAKFILYFVKFSFICAKLSLNFVILTSACAEMIWKMSISQDNEMWAIQIWINFNRLRICENVQILPSEIIYVFFKYGFPK